jgi:hypothetical protein
MGEEFRAVLWDVEVEDFDVEQHAGFLVRRVLEYGTWDEWRLLIKRLGFSRVGSIARDLPRLDPRALAFCSVVFRIPRETFAAFTAKQSPPAPWIS